jgi:hypothetical protein
MTGGLRDAPPPLLGTDRLVVALGRWDRLRDPAGIIHAFARHVRDQEAFLVVAGPAVGAVADDPEGGQVLSEARAAWRRLPAGRRRRIQLATLRMADLSENARIVNALLDDPALALELGGAGREQVRARYLADRHFVNWIDMLRRLPVGLGLAA